MWLRLLALLLAGLLTGTGAALVLDRPAGSSSAAEPSSSVASPSGVEPGPSPSATSRSTAPSASALAVAPTGQAPAATASAVTGSPVAPSPSVSSTATPAPAATSPAAPSPTPGTSPSAVAALDQQALAGEATARARLRIRLARVVRRHGRRDDAAVAVLDDRGQPLYQRESARQVVPASTQKLLVAGAALAVLGEDHRYVTTVRATARPRDGVLRGDLVLVGGGDPVLASPEFARAEPDRPRTPVARLAARVRAAGIRRVTGRVIGDPRVLGAQPLAQGWLPRYVDNLDATRVSGLTVDGGRRLFRRAGVLRGEAARSPARRAAAVLTVQLRDHGVRVAGGPRASRRPPATPAEVARVRSPRLAVLLATMVRDSDNGIADTVHRSLGAAAGDPTWSGSAVAVERALAPLALDWTGVVMADGSGLSRSNRVTAGFLVRLQERMWSSNLGPRWRSLLAVSGRRGTLRGRLVGTVAEGRLYGKTGSLRDVRSFVGTVTGPRGDVTLAVVGNGLTSAGMERVRELTDRLAVVAAEEVLGCRRVRRSAVAPERRRHGEDSPVRRRVRVRLVCDAA